MRVIGWISGILVSMLLLLLGAGYLVLMNMNLADLRPQIIAQVEAATGRSFGVGEDIEIGFNNGLTLRVSDLSLGNTDWARTPQMVTIGQAEARVGLLPLLSGELEIRHLDLKQVALSLEIGPEGQANWTIEDSSPGDGGGIDVVLRSLAVHSGRLDWFDAGSGGRDPITFDDLNLQGQIDLRSITLGGTGRINTTRVELDATVALPEVGQPSQAVALALRMPGDKSELRAEGTITRTDLGVMPRLQIQGRQLSMTQLQESFGLTLPSLPRFDLDGQLQRTEDTWAIDDLVVATERSDISGALRMQVDDSPPKLTLDLRSTELDLRDLGLTEREGNSDESTSQKRDTLFSTEPLPIPALTGLNAELSLNVDRLVYTGRPLQNVRVEAELDAGKLDITTFSAMLGGGGALHGTAVLDTSAPTPRWALDAKLDKAAAGAVFVADDQPFIKAPLDAAVTLKTRGLSPQQMAAQLSGTARINVGSGRAQLRQIDTLVGGVSTLTGQLLERGQGDAQLNCVIGNWSIDNGVATPQVLVIDSAVSTVRGDGRVDLGNERLDMTFSPRPKKPTLTVAVPVHVRGSLLAPEFQPDRTASLTKLIGVAGAFIYPPAAIAALGDLGSAGVTCGELLEGKAPPPESQSAVGSVTQGIEDAAKSIGRGIKGLFD